MAGVPPLVFGVVALIDLLYQFWVHTEHVGKLGWFDRWFCSPSNHRVHHAVNDRYLDRNYGGVLIVWDRLFGSFQEEDEQLRLRHAQPAATAGTRCGPTPRCTGRWRRTAGTRARWADKLRVWFKPPGWRPADVAARFPKPAFDIAQVQRYHPPVTRGVRVVRRAAVPRCCWRGVALFLWHADEHAAGAIGGLAGGADRRRCGPSARVLQGRLGVLEVLLVEAAALATASGGRGARRSCTASSSRWRMLLAIALCRARARAQPAAPARFDAAAGRRPGRSRWLGDVLLMLPGFFIPGLVALPARAPVLHRAVPAGRGAGSRGRRALAATLARGRGDVRASCSRAWTRCCGSPVAAYVVVIACMAAQAIGRAAVLRRSRRRAAVARRRLLLHAERRAAGDQPLRACRCRWRRSGCWRPTTSAQMLIVRERLARAAGERALPRV